MKLAALVLLARLATAAAPDTHELLRRTAAAMEGFWERLSAVDCVETVEQVKFAPGGKVGYRQVSSFDYLVLLQLAGNDIVVDESRTAIAEPKASQNVPLLVTNGFSTLSFIFHPVFQGAFEYSAPEEDQLDGAPALRVAFRHIAGARSPSVLKLRQRDYPVEWRGTAWIDPRTGSILRIQAGLLAPLDDIGLKALNADVRYGPVEFRGASRPDLLPKTATVEVETARQHWKNVHTFQNYKTFSVDVKSDVGGPK